MNKICLLICIILNMFMLAACNNSTPKIYKGLKDILVENGIEKQINDSGVKLYFIEINEEIEISYSDFHTNDSIQFECHVNLNPEMNKLDRGYSICIWEDNNSFGNDVSYAMDYYGTKILYVLEEFYTSGNLEKLSIENFVHSSNNEPIENPDTIYFNIYKELIIEDLKIINDFLINNYNYSLKSR